MGATSHGLVPSWYESLSKLRFTRTLRAYSRYSGHDSDSVSMPYGFCCLQNSVGSVRSRRRRSQKGCAGSEGDCIWILHGEGLHVTVILEDQRVWRKLARDDGWLKKGIPFVRGG